VGIVIEPIDDALSLHVLTALQNGNFLRFDVDLGPELILKLLLLRLDPQLLQSLIFLHLDGVDALVNGQLRAKFIFVDHLCLLAMPC